MSKSHKHIVEQAAQYGNVADSLDYELRGSRGKTWAGRWIKAHRERVIRACQQSILGGTLRPGKYRNLKVCERNKTRQAQSITLLRSIPIHAIMRVVEERITPTFVADTAASIKGRGGTYLLRRILRALHSDPDGMRYVWKDDITKFYQSIDQDLMMQVIRSRFRDRRLVRILERWVRMLPDGVSIGMRPSQGLANLLLSIYFDHIIKDQMGMRHMQRYCDDKTMESGDEYTLTHAIRTERRLMTDARLEIKPNAQMWDWQKRPVDYLGYVIFYSGKVRIRKHIKQRCPECNGAGLLQSEDVVEVSIPAGVASGMQLTKQGAGDDAPGGGVPGDLYIEIEEIADANLKRVGDDLVYNLMIDFSTAALGGKVEVPTVDGHVLVTIDPGTQPGSVLRLRGKGIPHLRARGNGDLLVNVMVYVPQSLNSDERAAIEQLAKGPHVRPSEAVKKTLFQRLRHLFDK